MSAPSMPSTFYTKSYQPGQAIFQEGQEGSYACLISQGRVEVCREVQGKKVSLAVLGRGDLFGEMALIGTDRRTASVLALEPTEVVIFDRDRLAKALDAGTPLLNNLVRSLIQRLASTTAMVRQQTSPAGQLRRLSRLLEACLEQAPADAQGFRVITLSRLAQHAQNILGLPAPEVREGLAALARHNLLNLEKTLEGMVVKVKSPSQLARQAEALADNTE